MGMLATVINALALQDALEQQGCHTRVMSAISVDEIRTLYSKTSGKTFGKRSCCHFGAGTGNPY